METKTEYALRLRIKSRKIIKEELSDRELPPAGITYIVVCGYVRSQGNCRIQGIHQRHLNLAYGLFPENCLTKTMGSMN